MTSKFEDCLRVGAHSRIYQIFIIMPEVKLKYAQKNL